jgi:hypothetical protein
VSFYNGFLNFTNWSGNVILPTLAGLGSFHARCEANVDDRR